MTEAAGLGAGRYLDAADVPEGTVTTAHELLTHDRARVSGLLREVPGATTVCVLMHPRQDFSHHVLVPELLSRGFAVWTQSTRGGLNDVSLLHEQALLDMAAGHRFLRERGFDRVVSVGHSGGGALAAYYIEQAEATPSGRFADTPGGKPVPLREADMPVPDALMLMAPHPGQGLLLERMIDPSVVDESDPLSVDSTLDPYDAENGFRPAPEWSSYSPDFVARYRAAQHARIVRIDEHARTAVARAAAARRRRSTSGDPQDYRTSLASGVITMYRSDADLRCVDSSLDPNDRPYGSLFGSRPDLTNYGVVGFGRLTTPEAWLSTWSSISSRAGLVRSARGVSVPVLLVEVTGDQACFPADAIEMADAFAGDDVTHERVRGKHFGAALAEGEPTAAAAAGALMGGWLTARGF
ncbi:alpha/beta hydrolase [Gordonia phthalatica]|uniref:Alpha/beta hydrolase family protein n=1 Tax=Gordonia phthalatica TaxID=1136941 RepID=A0A0N9N978_9ACTN|nr:alpha/beta hydrolase [Gordonia phthalatica]ALG84761.1 alpha/beta hydrolase family protein [Gordonia phthalatica]